MGTLYIDTGGSATNSGSTDTNAATLSGVAATVAASVVTLPAGTVLTSVVTAAGPTQSSIFLADASNSNRKIFWITATAGSGGATPTVTVDVAPTGVVSSAWAIGGRVVLTPASQEGALRAGDTAIFNNSPASSASVLWTFRNAGDATNGMAKLAGKVGTRPALTNTGTGNVIFTNALAFCAIENLEIIQSGASGTALNITGASNFLTNLKVSDAGGAASTFSSSARVQGCEISGVATTGIVMPSSASFIYGNYVHDNGGDGILYSGTSIGGVLTHNIFDTNAGRGIYNSSATAGGSGLNYFIMNNTVYGNGDSGLEITDIDISVGIMYNNIFMDNGNAAGEYNIEITAAAAENLGLHGYNIFFKTSNNLLNLTANATESTSDPLFVNAANGDFRLLAASPARAAGFPGQFLGGPLSYMDIGATQAQDNTGSGSGRYVRGHLGPWRIG